MRYYEKVVESEHASDCHRARCGAVAATRCAYSDRRGRPCPTAWCPQHLIELEGRGYCSRHASTLIALGPEMLVRGHLPELDNRVPSLVYWVGRDLDSDVPAILATLADRDAGERTVTDPVTLIAGGGRTSERRWERNWKIVSHTGMRESGCSSVPRGSPWCRPT
jgi:hypothetical protein